MRISDWSSDVCSSDLYITAVSVPASKPRFTAGLVQRFPNPSVIDIDAVLKQVRSIGDQVSTVVQVVFWFAFAAGVLVLLAAVGARSEEHTSELQSLMRISYAVFCLKKKKNNNNRSLDDNNLSKQ